MTQSFSKDNFCALCDQLARTDSDLQRVIDQYGYPPFWDRPNNFETLVHIILEQQVSLASAKAALEKLRDKIGAITPQNILLLNDEELKACYFSRQKASYVRDLAQNMPDLKQLAKLPDDEIRTELITLKGIGNWTVDIYLIMVLHRQDVFPSGDLAAVNALKKIKHCSLEEIAAVTHRWSPCRTIATMLLWHWYLSEHKPASATITP